MCRLKQLWNTIVGQCLLPFWITSSASCAIVSVDTLRQLHSFAQSSLVRCKIALSQTLKRLWIIIMISFRAQLHQSLRLNSSCGETFGEASRKAKDREPWLQCLTTVRSRLFQQFTRFCVCFWLFRSRTQQENDLSPLSILSKTFEEQQWPKIVLMDWRECTSISMNIRRQKLKMN